MLLVIRTQPAIIRTPIVRFGIEDIRSLRRFVVIPDVLIIRNIIRDQYLRLAMLSATLEHVHLVVFKNYFGIDAFQAFGTKT
jgi:hypothetical protein